MYETIFSNDAVLPKHLMKCCEQTFDFNYLFIISACLSLRLLFTNKAYSGVFSV